MPYIFVRRNKFDLDECNPFDATRLGRNKMTLIDFQIVEDGNDSTLSKLSGVEAE